MSDTISDVRDQVAQTQMAILDIQACAHDAQVSGGFKAFADILDTPEYGEACKAAAAALRIYWEMTRKRKWPGPHDAA